MSRLLNDKKLTPGGRRTYSNTLRCRLSRFLNDKKRASEHRRTYSNTRRCGLSRLAMIKNNASEHRRAYSNTRRCRLSRLAMIKNNASGHRRTYSNALRCGLSRLAMIKFSRREAGVLTQMRSKVVHRRGGYIVPKTGAENMTFQTPVNRTGSIRSVLRSSRSRVRTDRAQPCRSYGLPYPRV